jgi:UDP-2,3-diacylglucosamine pyrophosphatase LpxH
MGSTASTHNLLIVSDLHLSEGFSIQEGKFSRLEDFFSDQPFADFLAYHQHHREEDQPWRLIIAGDLFDFLQITSLPANTPEELKEKIANWEDDKLTAYSKASHQESHYALTASWLDEIESELRGKADTPAFNTLRRCLATLKSRALSDKAALANMSEERLWLLEQLLLESWILANTEAGELPERTIEYGLGTSWQETVWKLDRIAEGHPVFFRALGQFASSGNELMVMTGNHDIELFWKQVQQRLGQLLADAAGTAAIQITFLPWIYYEPELIYLEHGQQYEGANACENILQPTLPDNEQLIQLPPGSMLVRYLINKIEEEYPFVDNIRPITRFFSWAFENELIKLITIMIRYAGGFSTFVMTFLKRSKSQRKPEAFANSVQSLNSEAQEILTQELLEEIDEAAREIRQGIFRRFYLFRTLALLFLVGLLVLLFLGIISVPLIILLIEDVTSSLLKISLPLVSLILGFIFKQFIAPKLLRVASGEHYLEKAAERVAEILEKQKVDPVRYIIFGHNHDPDIVKVVSEDTWYVNTGSWLYSQGIVEEWLQQTKYHSFLKIVRGKKVGASPELRFWNSNTGKPEQIRLRAQPPKKRKSKR